jgi:hypothetical protein
MKSQANTVSVAPPHTLPSIMAMTGPGKFSISRTSWRSGSSQPSGSRRDSGSSSTSWPAENTLAPGLARKITTRAFACWNERSASMVSSTRGWLKAFRRRSLSSVIVPIESTDLARMWGIMTTPWHSRWQGYDRLRRQAKHAGHARRAQDSRIVHFRRRRDAGQDHRAAKGAPATAGYASSRKKTSAEVHARWCRWES